jgi:ATP-dependent helicase/nuclease subunit A
MTAESLIDGIESSLKDEKIVVQGAVDLMLIEEDGIVIVDFKTDRVRDENALIESYAEQLRIYADACSKITGLKVKEKIIYSLVLDRSIVV